MAGLAYPLRGHGFAEPIAGHVRRPHGPSRDQRHDALEMGPIASDAGPQGNDVAAVRLWRLCAGGDKGRPAARFQHRERPLRDISADGIEDGVAVSHGPGEIHRIVVDDLIGADLAKIIMVRRACGRDHARTQIFCQLDGKARNTARAALDQDRLARLQLQCVFDGADRRQPGKRQRCGIDMRQAIGFPGDDGGLDRNLLGIGAFLADVADGKNLIADTQVGDTLSNR